MRQRRPLQVLVVLLCVCAPALSAQQPSDRLTLDLFLQWEDVGDPQLSPDGEQIVYTRRWVDPVNDERQSSVWIMNADGTRARHLIDGSSPVWSPDGTRIAFIDEGDPKGSQIFVRWMDAEGAVSQITRLTESPSDIEWSPDSRSIAFQMLVPTRDTWRVDLPPRPEGAEWTEDPRIIQSLNYRRDGTGFTPEGHDHIFVVSADGGQAMQITSGDFDHDSHVWMPNGERILFSALRVEDAEYRWRESFIYAVDVASREIWQLTDRHGPDNDPVPSPDGSLIAYTGYDWTDDTYIESKLYLIDADGSNPREIAAELDRSPSGLTWAEDDSGVYFSASSEGTRNLYFASTDGGVRQVTEGNHMLSVSDINADGVAVGTVTSYHDPGNVVVFDVNQPQELRRLTATNEALLANVELGEVEEIWYKSVDDFDIQGWIVKPPDFDPNQKYPLILAIHGGPHGMYNVGFNFGWQNHAAEGYVVLYTNPRGSSGYGSAFGNAIKRAYPGRDYDDLMAGVDSVVNRGYIDERNMFVYGCSGGGVLTAWVVGHTDRFAAASANCPVTNWLSFVGTTDGSSWYRNFDNLPWEDPSEHLRRSPLMYVGNVTTPTMLMTGQNDLRTPMAQTEEYYQALKYLKVPTAMLRFQDEWHGTSSRPSNFMRTQLYLRSWFERFSTPGPATADDS